jgi:hypothetical protein
VTDAHDLNLHLIAVDVVEHEVAAPPKQDRAHVGISRHLGTNTDLRVREPCASQRNLRYHRQVNGTATK